VRSTQGVRSDAAPVAVAFGWLVVVAAMLALVEYWRWVLVGLAVLVGVAVLGVLLEWLQARRHQPGTDSARARSSRR
jgi:fatty acid desaturase